MLGYAWVFIEETENKIPQEEVLGLLGVVLGLAGEPGFWLGHLDRHAGCCCLRPCEGLMQCPSLESHVPALLPLLFCSNLVNHLMDCFSKSFASIWQ